VVLCKVAMHSAGIVCGRTGMRYCRTGIHCMTVYPLKLHLTTSELWFGQQQEGILPELLSISSIV